MIAREDFLTPGGETPRLLADFTATDLQRFAAKIEQWQDGCWLWTAFRDRKGYGQFWFRTRMMWAHRWSYAAFVGEIPAGVTIDHACCNPSCVNPAHLRLSSRAENTAEGNRNRVAKDEEVPF